jgi:hypothetical protein
MVPGEQVRPNEELLTYLRPSGNSGWHALKGRGEAVASTTTPFAKLQGVPPVKQMNSRTPLLNSDSTEPEE